jgi:hypothetical protein
MSDLDVEFQKFSEFLQGWEPGKIPVDEILRRAVVFFEKLQAIVEKWTNEEKKEGAPVIADLAQKMIAGTKIFIESVGLSEADLFMLMEKPIHFNEDQWKLMQESKRLITECAKRIASALIVAQPATAEKVEQQVEKKDTKKHIPPPRSSWMKS